MFVIVSQSSSSSIPVEQCCWPDGGQQIRRNIILKGIIYRSFRFGYMGQCGAHLQEHILSASIRTQVADLWLIWLRMFRVCGCLTCETADPIM